MILARHACADTDGSGFSPGGVRDFAAYWAAARLLVTGGNPYSLSELFALQKSAGLTEATPLIMWNPPWTLSLTLPFGFLEFAPGQFLWLLVHACLVLVSVQMFSPIYFGSANRYRLAWLLAVTSIPTVYALILGQITPVILFGLAAFTVLERGRKEFAARAATVLLSIKPHFIYLFWIAFFLWVWHGRRWRVVQGALLAFVAAGVIPLVFDPAVYRQFLDVHSSGEYLRPLDLPVPTLRVVLRHFFSLEGVFFDYLPSAIGAAWLLGYWRRHRDGWEWPERLPLILLVSVTTSVYTWTFDQVVFLPAIIQIFGWLERRTTLALAIYVGFNALYLRMRYIVPVEFWYFWMAPLFLLTYLVLRNRFATARSSPAADPEVAHCA